MSNFHNILTPDDDLQAVLDHASRVTLFNFRRAIFV